MNDIAKVSREEQITQVAITKMGRMLVDAGKITDEHLQKVIAKQTSGNLRFGEAAIALGLVTEADISAVLAAQFAYTTPPDQNTRLDNRLTVVFNPESRQAEAMRSLRSELMLRYFNAAPQASLALIGAENVDAIALTAANLAAAFAQLGIRTLLIDSNLRNPQIHQYFGLSERNIGLSDLIAQRALVSPTAIPGLHSLWVLPAGTPAPNPQELIASKHYAEAIASLSRNFDVVLIATHPLDSARDAQLIATQAGAAALVIHENASRFKDIEAICQRLKSLDVRVVGAALYQ